MNVAELKLKMSELKLSFFFFRFLTFQEKQDAGREFGLPREQS
jgi:hypothetical protein